LVFWEIVGIIDPKIYRWKVNQDCKRMIRNIEKNLHEYQRLGPSFPHPPAAVTLKRPVYNEPQQNPDEVINNELIRISQEQRET